MVANFVYVLRLSSDKSLYCGATKDFDKRIRMHLSGKGSKYVRSRHCKFIVMITWMFDTWSDALKFEHWFKHLTKDKKEELLQYANYNKLYTGHLYPVLIKDLKEIFNSNRNLAQ